MPNPIVNLEAILNTYSTPAFRSFKVFIGELTAVAAGIHVGIQEAISHVSKLDQSDPWESAAQRHGIRVSGLRSEKVSSGAIRLNIVSLYSGFDLFISDIRGQFYAIHGKSWTQNDGDTPFQALLRNTPSGKQAHEKRLGPGRILTMDYYRLARNAIAHPSNEAVAIAEQFYHSNNQQLIQTASDYGMKSTPSEVAGLSFHDIKYMARVSLDLAVAIDKDFDPGDVVLSRLLPEKFAKLPKSEARRHNAKKGWLSEKFGINSDRTERIISMTHKLSG